MPKELPYAIVQCKLHCFRSRVAVTLPPVLQGKSLSFSGS